MVADENKIVATKWSSKKPSVKDHNFNMSPVFTRHKIERAFGSEYVEAFGDSPYFAEDIFVEKYLKNTGIKSVLSLCCGFGRVEQRIVKRLDTVERCLGVDIARGAVKIAAQEAEKQQINTIEYVCADLNEWDWGKEKFDLVIAYGALHHLKNLEVVLDGIHNCLNPDGFLFSHEYIGLPYYGCSPRQLQLINAVAFMVPVELRMRRGIPFTKPKAIFRLISNLSNAASGYYDESWPVWKKTLVRAIKVLSGDLLTRESFAPVLVSPEDLIRKKDPSEGVSALRILSALSKKFGSLDVMHSGGSILEHALDSRFYSEFDETNALHRDLADMLWEIERFYTDVTEEIGPHNVYLVAQK